MTRQKSRNASSRSKTPSSKGKSSGTRSSASSRSRSKAAVEETSSGALSRLGGTLKLVVDGRGHDVWGMLCLILAVLIGASVYSGATGGPSSWPDTATGSLVGVLRVLVPPVLVLAGVLLIRGPREVEIDLSEGIDDDEYHTSAPSTGVRTVGIMLVVVVVAGVLDVLLAEDRTITADGYDAYAGAGGMLGAGVGGMALLVGRWTTLAVLVLFGIFALSLITGWSLRLMGQTIFSCLAPLFRSFFAWFSSLFRVGDLADDASDDETELSTEGVELFDQDAGLPAPKKSRKKAKKPDELAVVVAGNNSGDSGEPHDPEQLQIGLGPAGEGSVWRLPPLKLLALSGKRDVDEAAVAARGRQLEGALAEHGVETRLVGMVVGPTVTRYELELGVGVKVARVTSLNKDIAYAMASPDVRILAPIPGRQAIGIEVPNHDRQIVHLGDILTSGEAHRATHPLEVGVGRDISGTSVMLNLAKMPHLLIAGQTGAGKSSCINSVITSLLMRTTPEQVRMILIDPKQVELTQYNRIPHLLTQVVTNPKKAANALNWAVLEMERRYDLLSEVGVRDITGYNAAFDRGDLVAQLGEDREFKRMPFILVVVDELADLMMVASRDVEESITRIAAKARAVGIHLVIATQRPSVNVITGVIKANIPARLAFSVASATDSKVVLDQVGAERLVGQGDMLLLSGSSSAQRIQGAWVDEAEVSNIVAQWRRQAPTAEETFVEGVAGDENTIALSGHAPGGGSGGGGGDDDDELVKQALELVVRSGLGSTSMLQRKLKVGFARAGRLMDLLEQRGVVGPSEGSKARTVMMTPDELDDMIERGDL